MRAERMVEAREAQLSSILATVPDAMVLAAAQLPVGSAPIAAFPAAFSIA